MSNGPLASQDGPLRYVADGGSAMTLPALLDARAEASGDATFVSFEGRRLSYADALRRAERTGAALSALGVRRGDAVAVMLPNRLEFLDVWFGCALVGAVLVPVNTALKGDGLRYVLEHSESRLIVTVPGLTDEIDGAVGAAAGPAVRVVCGEEQGSWLSFDALVAAAGTAVVRATVVPDDIASVLYTSGTTGMPKGVMNGHDAFVTTGHVFARDYVRMRSDDVLYTTLPLFHVNAQMLTTMGSLASGRPMVLAPRFSASGFFADVRAHGATVFNYIGAMLTMLHKQPEAAGDADGPARLAVGGAAPAELWPAFERRFGLTILEAYGLTETACMCLGNPPDDIRVGRLGTPVGWADVTVRREDGRPADPGEPGEIAVRAKRPGILFGGYFKAPEATAAAFADGWFLTGDRGVVDDDGYFAFLDRLKDTIRRRGENISSFQVEQVVDEHPAVAACAAVGVPSDLGEDEVLIAIVPQADLDPAEIVAFCRRELADFMVPRYVRVVDALPRTATERVQKHVLRADGIAGAWDRLAPGNGPEAALSASGQPTTKTTESTT